MTYRVSENSHPSLSWKETPPGTWIISEMIQSDAFRCLTKIETDLILLILTLRQYPKKKKNYWKPNNRDHFKCPGIKIEDFFDGNVRGMICTPPSYETMRRAFQKFMEVGFLSIKQVGGNGPGDQNIYQLENKWRVWKKGDPPCYSRQGLSREKGFCIPNSGSFYIRGRNCEIK